MNTQTVPKVFFNASVILAGFASSNGGSALLLKWIKQKKIKGVISEVILEEVKRRAYKVNLTSEEAGTKTKSYFFQIIAAPPEKLIEKYSTKVIDAGDAHVLASSEEAKVNYLVSLDKKHILAIQKKINICKIVSPKQLLEKLSQ